MRRPHWSDSNKNILKLKPRDSRTRYKFVAIYIPCGLRIQTCLELCDPKKSHPVAVCRVEVVY
jgi:hypothetical protein